MTTVTVDKQGKVGLPEDVLKESHIQPGSQLVVLAHEGKIVLLDKERFRQQVEQPAQEVLAQFRRSIASAPQAPFLGGLTFEEYAALSEEEETALWERLSAEAEKELRHVKESDVPAHFRPAGQKRGARNPARRAATARRAKIA